LAIKHISDFIIKIIGIKTIESSVTEDEIKAIIEEGASEGAIGAIEHEIVKNVFHLGDKRISSLMTYRQNIVWLNLADDLVTNREKILRTSKAYIPYANKALINRRYYL
jgi:putative hemolysin